MQTQWLHKQGRGKLILFCNGWGMDETPFRHLASQEYDVCMFYNYTNMHTMFDFVPHTARYDEVNLVGWSMGVWAGQKLFSDVRGAMKRRIAINGTLCPIDDSFGIPRKIFSATLDAFDEDTRFKFYRRMCREKTVFKMFLNGQPQRSLISQKEELASLLLQADSTDVGDSMYSTVLIADSDWVFPTVNQHRYWQGSPVIELAGFHYLFHLWQSWDHLLAFTDDPGGIH